MRALLPLSVLLLAACQPQPLTIEQAVANNVTARGGADALDAVTSQRIDVSIEEGGATYVGQYAATTDGLVRIDIFVEGKRVYSEGIDRYGVWLRSGDGLADESQATGARNALAHGAEDHLFGWHRFTERGHKLSLLPAQTIDGRDHHVVEIRYNTDHVSYFYLDPETWLAVRKRDERAYHPDIDPQQIRVETVPSEFAETEGVIFSDASEDRNLDTKEILSTNHVLSRTINPEFCPTYFDRERVGPAMIDDPLDC